MSRRLTLLIAVLMSGLFLTALSLFIMPKDSVVTGPSCPICQDVDGGKYHHIKRGWPLRYLHLNDPDPIADGPGYESRTSFKPMQFVGDWALWTAVSGIVLVVVLKVRKRK